MVAAAARWYQKGKQNHADHRGAGLGALTPQGQPRYSLKQSIVASASAGRYNLIVQLVGVACVVTLPFWSWGLFFSSSWYEYGVALFVVPFLFLLNLLLVLAVARRDPFLQRLLPVALLLKLAAAGAYVWMVFHLYGASADMVIYWNRGEQIATDLLRGGHWTTLHPVWSSNFIYMLTGAIFSVTTVSLPSAVVIYALAAFWGQYLFYRTFVLVFPEGNHKLAALLLFFLPSIVFWTANIGKDAAILFFLGISAYGFARVQRRVNPVAVLLLLLGLGGVMLVRPHIAAMLGIAFLLPYLVGKNLQGMTGTVGKILGIPLVLGSTVWLARQAQSFLKMETLSQASSILETVANANYTGGSAITVSGSLPYRLVNVPFLFFRPWPWEVHSLQSVVAALEGLLLLWIFVSRRRDLYAAVRNWRSKPFVLFVLLFAFQFSVVMSLAITNFGLLTRERVMLLPFVMMLFCTRAAPVAVRQGAVPQAGRRPAPAPPPVPAYRSHKIPTR